MKKKVIIGVALALVLVLISGLVVNAAGNGLVTAAVNKTSGTTRILSAPGFTATMSTPLATEQIVTWSVTGPQGPAGESIIGPAGYTPIKGVDYFDGAKGDKGDKGDPGTGLNYRAGVATIAHHNDDVSVTFSGTFTGDTNYSVSAIVIGNTPYKLSIPSISASGFTIHCEKEAGSGGITVRWIAMPDR